MMVYDGMSMTSSLMKFCIGFGFYKSLQGYNYYQNIAKHDSISKHFDITKDEDLLILNRKGTDTNIKKSAVLVIVSEDDNNYHVKYNDDTVYVISKKDKNKPPYKLVK